MKITPIDIIKEMSGKVCSHSDTYISLNTSSGKMFTGKRCHPYTGPATADQLAQQASFKERAAKVSAWLNANKPSATNGIKGTAAYQLAQSIKKALQLSNVRQVICRYMDASGTVTLPSGDDNGNGNLNPNTNTNTNTNGNANPNGNTSQGGDTSGGGGSQSGGGNTGGEGGLGDDF